MSNPIHAPGAARARRKPEILAPAGDAPALEAALQNGADAVYFGLREGFNARARAGNFDLATLPETVAIVHRAGARAYLALNTLLFEPELEAAAEVVLHAAAAGVDALIVQDPAIALLAREVAPGLDLHASTQMTISSPEAAAFAARLGIRRVVLPRELSVREIGAFVGRMSLEVEVFVHGALCVSWSGQCLTSEAWGGRSANRGQCAQSCRLPYDLVVDGVARDLGDVKYLLSPKDLAGARAVPELVALGVQGLKIEGRQKGPQYVATAVAGYRRWVDAVADGRARDAEITLRHDLQAMSLSFSRGFGDGFLAGSDHQTLVEGRFPKHRGVYLGRVVAVEKNTVVVAPGGRGQRWTGGLALDARALHPQGEVSAPLPALGGSTQAATGAMPATLEPRAGHGVVFDAGAPEDKHEPGGPIFEVGRQGKNWMLRFGRPGPDLRRVAPGQRVWITSDPALVRLPKQRSAAARVARIGLEISVSGREGEGLGVEARAGLMRVHIESAIPATRARSEGLSQALLESKLCAFGGTPFQLATLDTTQLAPGLHVPVSELKAMRRRLVAALEAEDAATEPTVAVAPSDPAERARTAVAGFRAAAVAAGAGDSPLLVPLCRSEAQLEAALATGVPEVELDWMELVGLQRAVERARAAGVRVTLATLRVQKPGEESFDGRLARLEPDGVLVRHWGGLMDFARRRTATSRQRLHGDFSLNVTNSITARLLLQLGLDTFTVSHDLDESQLFALLEGVPAGRAAVVVHHRIAAFHTEHCVYAHLLSAGRDHRSCGRPCEQHTVALRDPRQREHPVIVDAGCRNTVFNAELQSSARLVPRLLRQGVRRFRIEFVRETHREALEALAAYTQLLQGNLEPAALLAQLGAEAQQGVGTSPMQLLV